MTRTPAHRSRVVLAFSVAVAVMAGGLVGVGQDQPLDPATSIVSADNPADGLSVRRRDKRGLARFAAAAPQRRGIRLPVRPNAGGSELALDFVDRYGAQFGIQQRAQLRLRRRTADALGEHVRFEQVHRGVPVTGGQFIVHLSGTDVTAANGAILDDLPDDVVPTVSPADAILEARLTVEEYDPAQAAQARYAAPRLEIWAPEAFGDQLRTPRLAWFVEATADTLRRFIWIDAENGDRLLTFNQMAEAKARSVYTGNAGSLLPGSLLRSEGAPATGDVDADRAYDYSGFAYDYFKNTHNRDSYDGLGAPLVSTVHHCEPFPEPCPWNNAYWNGVQMVYGDGYASADDVVAHELTHAVTETSAGLFYYMQSGALNESFSDIFGETVDLTDGAGTDTAGVRWRMGEDLPIGAIRNMMTPTLFNDPGKMSDAQYVCNPLAEQGNGGVHTNSGVANHAYALAVDGGVYNGKTIAGIGLTKAGTIWYRALTVYLTPASTFQDAYTAISQSATDLIGTAGITASNRDQVVAALQAVEMHVAQPSACLRLLAPNSGESWAAGTARLVSWTAAGFSPGGQVYVLLSQDAGLTEYPVPIAVLPPGTTSYLWTPLPAHVTAAARLFVGHLVNSVYEAKDWSDQNFAITAAVAAPTVTTGAASAHTQASATVSGTVNPNGASTTLYFDYGLTISYSHTATFGALGSGVASLSRSYNVTGLNCATTYQYRARAQSSNGTTNGSNQAFTTGACPQPGTAPAVTTGAAGSITQTGATVGATVNPNGASTTLYIDYGPTASYGSLATFGVIGSGSSAVTQPTNLTGLSCSTTYQYRARAQSSNGTTNGANQAFTTGACPAALPAAFSKTGVPANGATAQPLTATLGWAASAGATSYEYCIDAVNNTACDTTWTSTVSLSVGVAGLNPGATYWWQVRARTLGGTTDANSGAWWSFTTQLPPGTYFSSDLEGHVANWTLQSPWALTTESAHTSTHAWSDSPGGNYGSNKNVSVTSPSIDLRAAVTPRLRFWRRYGFAADGVDSWHVWVTTDNGVTYTHLQQFVGTDLTWKESILDLTPFTGFAAVRVLFQVVTNGSLSGDGLYLDDIVVEESSASTVTVTAPDPNASEVGLDPGTFTFARTGSTAAALTVNFTTGGGATLAADYADVGWTSVVIPVGQASASKTVTPVADASLEGAETVMVTLGPGSYAVGAPASATVTIADAAPATRDLTITTVSAPPAVASPGSVYVAGDTTLNQGTGLAGASTTRFYLSLDALRNSGDKLVGARAVPSLDHGVSSPGSTTVTIPTTLAPGTYFHLACADDLKVVAENNEANNCLASGSTVQVVRADLVDTAVSNPPASVPPGGKFTVTDTVLNPSGVWAGASTTRYYLSLDAAKSAGDVMLSGTRSAPALPGGASSLGSRLVTVPATTALNTYRLLACADDSAKVSESNEGNNCTAAAGSVVVGMPDLRTTLVNGLPPTVQRGKKMAPADTVLNQGAAPSGTSSTRYYLSPDAAWSAGDVLLTGSRSIPTLAPNQTSGGSRTVTVPLATAVGTYFVLACADDTKKVVEGNETNNCVASPTTIAITP